MRLSVLFPLFFFLLFSCKKNQSPILRDQGFVYVANQNDESISVIDLRLNKVMSVISVSVSVSDIMMPHNVHASPDGKTIWATVNAMDFTVPDQLVVIDPKTNRVLKKVAIGKAVHVAHVVFDDNGERAYATATDSNFVAEISTSTFEVVRKIPLGPGHRPHGLRYSNGCLFVSNMMSESASVIDLRNFQIKEIPLDGMAMQTAVTKNGGLAYFSLYDMMEIAVYDVLKDTVMYIPLPPEAKGPVQIALTPDDKQLFICDQGLLGDNASDKVFVLNTQTRSVSQTIIAEKAAHGISIEPNGNRAFVSNSLSNSVSVIDVKNGQVISSIKVGKLPVGITFWGGPYALSQSAF